MWTGGRPGAGDQLVQVRLWLQLPRESLLKEKGQKPAKLLHGHHRSGGDIEDGKCGFGQH